MMENMDKMLYLTEEDIKLQEEQNRRKKVLLQKELLQKKSNDQAKMLSGELHNKTHYKAVT